MYLSLWTYLYIYRQTCIRLALVEHKCSIYIHSHYSFDTLVLINSLVLRFLSPLPLHQDKTFEPVCSTLLS